VVESDPGERLVVGVRAGHGGLLRGPHLLPSLEEQLTDGLDEPYRSTSAVDDPIAATGESAGDVVDLRRDGDQ
jgi:hypothetical protein